MIWQIRVFSYANYNYIGLINIGMDQDLTIRELALLVKKIVGFRGDLVFDIRKSDGTPRKLMDVSKLHNMGCKHITLEKGLALTLRRLFKELFCFSF